MQVGENDTAQTIALVRGLTVAQLQVANSVADVNVLRPGSVICVPKASVCNQTYTPDLVSSLKSVLLCKSCLVR